MLTLVGIRPGIEWIANQARLCIVYDECHIKLRINDSIHKLFLPLFLVNCVTPLIIYSTMI